jgi:hypothetical protein
MSRNARQKLKVHYDGSTYKALPPFLLAMGY